MSRKDEMYAMYLEGVVEAYGGDPDYFREKFDQVWNKIGTAVATEAPSHGAESPRA